MRITKRNTLALLAAGLVGCGGGNRGNPAGPSAPAPSQPVALTLVSGETDQPVTGATVHVAGLTLTSGADGRVTLDRPPANGSAMDVVAAGFLDRLTLFRTGAVRLTLWPRTSPTGLDESYTGTLVYTSSAEEDPPFAEGPLRRLRLGVSTILVVPDSSVTSDAASLRMHEVAVDELTRAARGAVTYRLAAPGTTGPIVFTAALDPGHEGCDDTTRGFITRRVAASEIVGGSIVYCLRDAARAPTVIHELGHSFGLEHSSDARELMAPFFTRQRAVEFGGRETLVMGLLLQRRGGNRFPDNDREASSSAYSGTITTYCE